MISRKGAFLIAALMLLGAPRLAGANWAQGQVPKGLFHGHFACGWKNSSFCFNDSGLIAEEQSTGGDIRTLKLYMDYWKDKAGQISYPRSCETRSANTLQLLGYSPYHPVGDKIYYQLIFRTRTDGSCDLTLLAPSKAIDPGLGSLSALLTETRVCVSGACQGPKLVSVVPHKLNLFR